MGYEDIARSIKRDLDTELGFTFSIGLAPTKVLAKVGSKWKKPNGLTVIKARDAHIFLSTLPVGKVWGIGPQTNIFLQKNGIKTAYEFASCSEDWIKRNLSKPFQEIFYELRAINIYEINTEVKDSYASISKVKTFSPGSGERDYVFSQLSKNIENACIKLRRHNLRTKKAVMFLKTQDFRYQSLEVEVENYTNAPQTFIGIVEKSFQRLWKDGVVYRGTGVHFLDLRGGEIQQDLFGSQRAALKSEKIFESIDKMSEKYGKHTVFLGSSFEAVAGKKENTRNAKPERHERDLLKGETLRKHLNIPIIGSVD